MSESETQHNHSKRRVKEKKQKLQQRTFTRFGTNLKQSETIWSFFRGHKSNNDAKMIVGLWRVFLSLCLCVVVSGQTLTSCDSSVDANNVTTPVPGCLVPACGSGSLANYPWVLANNQSSFFTVVTDLSRTWSGARTLCRTMFGGDLAVPKSHEDFIIMQSLLSPSSSVYYIGGLQNLSALRTQYFVLGAPINSEPESGWKWIDGTMIDMTQETTRWAVASSKISYPSDSKYQGCVGIQTGRNGIVEVTNCTISRGFFCSIKGISSFKPPF
jgi:hypothetical protein